MSFARSMFLAFLVLAGLAVVSKAADTTATYDIRDLLIAIPDYAESGKPTTQPTRDAMLVELLSTLQELLPAGSTLRELNGQLILTAEEAAHKQARDFLGIARQQRGLQVMTEARVVRMPAAVFAGLPDDLRFAIKAAALQNAREPAELSAEQTADLTKLLAGGSHGANTALPAAVEFNKNAQTPAACSVLTAPRLTTFNNQSATVAVTTETNFVKALWNVTGTDGKMEIQSEIGSAKSGTTLTLRGRANHDAATTAVQFKLVVNRLLSVETVPTEDGNVQRPVLQAITFAGLYNVPRDHTLLLMPTEVTTDKQSDNPAILSEAKGPATTDLTFVLLRVLPIVQREIEEAKPLLAEPPARR